MYAFLEPQKRSALEYIGSLFAPVEAFFLKATVHRNSKFIFYL